MKSNLIQRTITGVLFVVVLVGAILWTPISFGTLFALITALSVREFGHLMNRSGQVEINRILYSNAGYKVKKNARILMDYMEVPAFDTISDNYSLSQIQKEPYLYIDCYVQWKGTLANIKEYENLTTADLLVGYDTKHRVEGIVPMEIKAEALSFEIDPKLPVTVLGRVKLRDSRVSLDCVSLYQNIKSEI